MGLLDNLLNTVAGGGAAKNTDAIGGIVEMLNHPQVGGVQGLVGKFAQGNMGHILDSWVSTGKNKAVNANQISSLLGSDVVAQFAKKLGISPAAAEGQIAKYLPLIIDKLTPDGKMPSSNNLNVQDILGKFLK
jgi:uncharacterized protein YidB (DUF937 family)